MRYRLLVTILFVAFPQVTRAVDIPRPDEVLGFQVGEDFRLADYEQISAYFEKLASASERVELRRFGQTTEGRDLLIALTSAPENMNRIDALIDINRQLSSGRLPEDDASRAAQAGKAFVVIGASIHASEVGASQMSMELAYRLAAGLEPGSERILRETVLVLIPSMNPDGLAVEVDWYRKQKGTPFEGGPTPWLYHKYVGHDINRDYFMLNLAETRAMNELFYRELFPQVFLTMHQMGTYGPRMFVPPHYDPPNPLVHSLLIRQTSLLGQAMASALEAAGKSGVVTDALFDEYFAGYEDSAPMFHNVICLLSEVASVRRATPLFIEKDQLRAGRLGLPDLSKSIRYPNPWPGGWWRLSDIVAYDRIAALGLLDAAASHRESLLLNIHRMAASEIAKGQREPPFAYVIPTEQWDPATSHRLIDVLMGAGVEVHRAKTDFDADGIRIGGGSFVILASQPYRPFLKALLEPQRYPERRLYPEGPPERPYDVTGWTLPLQMGVDSLALSQPLNELDLESLDSPPESKGTSKAGSSGYALRPRSNAALRAINLLMDQGVAIQRATKEFTSGDRRFEAGTFLIPPSAKIPLVGGYEFEPLSSRPSGSVSLKRPRTGLYRPWGGLIDEGWTRWLLETYRFPFTSIRPEHLRDGTLARRVDLLLMPDLDKERLVQGRKGLPPTYKDGIGEKGVTVLSEFVEEGGTLLAFDSAVEALIELLGLPVHNLASSWEQDEFFCPGALLHFRPDPEHPLAYGMPKKSVLFFGSSPAMKLSAGARATIAAGYPPRGGARDLLASGWAIGEQKLAGLPVAVDIHKGDGHVVLLAFRPQHRGQSHATFKMIFNALFRVE